MKRYAIIFILMSSACFGLSNRTVFIKARNFFTANNYTIEQVADATDEQVINQAGLDPNEAYQWKRWRPSIKRIIKAKLKEQNRLVRQAEISIPALTQIIIDMKAEGLTTAEAKVELLQTAIEQLQ